jgi:opacity protein-like surface antigen
MKLHVLGAAAMVLGIAAPAIANDVTPGVVDLVEVTPDWSGFYVGAHGGYGKGNRNGCGDLGFVIDIRDKLEEYFGDWLLDDDEIEAFNALANEIAGVEPPDPIESCAAKVFAFDYDQAGVLFGVQAGYNWMATEQFLIGVELSASSADISGEVNGWYGGVGAWDSLATATAKVGLVHDRFLVYGELGFGVANASFHGDVGCKTDVDHNGPVAGAGVSYKVTDIMSVDLKYQHVWLGAAQSACDLTAGNIWSDHATFPAEFRTEGSLSVVKLGLNFQIGK